MLLGNASRGKIIAKSVVDAPRGLARLFMLRKMHPSRSEALRFRGPAFWATFAPAPIDIVFIDAKYRVVGIVENLARWRATGEIANAESGFVLEGGSCARVPVCAGDLLELTPLTSERVAAGAEPPEHF
ncbi:MAG: DUF192 domain-containing protein [Planctomycetota bacterium]